ncbi:MAG: hypothetical protein ACE5GS_05980 [Kiloniellaceae bacterium]
MPLAAISVVSAGVIGLEVLLMRLYSIWQWHHFAYMIISIALLGYGASGTFLALTRRWLLPRFLAAWQANAALFGLTAVAGYALARRLPFNPLELPWDPRQALYLSATYLLLMVPFFCAANCVGLAFIRYGGSIGRVYRYDLMGAGAGAVGVIAALFALPPGDSLRLLPALGLGAAALAGLGREGSRRQDRGRAAALAACGVALAALLPGSWIAPRPSEYKGLSLALRAPGAEVVHESASPLGVVSVVRSPRIPFRHAPGLSLNSVAEPPEQLGVFTDGDAMTAIARFDGDRDALTYLDFTIEALAYHLLERPDVLILGAGGGAGVLLARYHRAARIDAVERNPAVVALVRDRYADFAGRIYDPGRIGLAIAEPRSHVSASARRYDLIQAPILDGGGAGLGGLSETYSYTVEAFEDYLAHLNPGGLISVTRPLKLPPRDALKLFATALQALERAGAAAPGRRLVLVRGWSASTLLVKNGAFTAQEIDAVRAFARARSFDLTYYPGMRREEANRLNVLDAPYFFDGTTALLGPQREAFLARYKFDLRPASDDRPYFFDFFKWRTLPELLELRRAGAMPLIEWGYLILVATLVQAAALSAALVLLPLFVWRRRGARAPGRRQVAVYFLALGLAFLFVEIAFIQRLVLFLGHPLYAVAVVLAAFLVFAGLGAGAAPRLADRLRVGGRVKALDVAVAGISLVAVSYLVVLPPVMGWLMPAAAPIKVAAALLVIAPLAFWMGMPFPLGLADVTERAPQLVPWAWGINGCASVISAVLATLLAIDFGFTAVVGLAVALYLLAAAAWRFPF